MKARTIEEGFNFERGISAKKSLDIGISKKLEAEAQYELRDKCDWSEKAYNLDEVYQTPFTEEIYDLIVKGNVKIISADEIELPYYPLKLSLPKKYSRGIWGMFDGDRDLHYLIEAAGWGYPRFITALID